MDILQGEAEVKKFIAAMLEKYALNTEMWKREMNEYSEDHRNFTFSFESGGRKNAFVMKANFIVTNLEVILDDELREEFESMIESGNIKI